MSLLQCFIHLAHMALCVCVYVNCKFKAASRVSRFVFRHNQAGFFKIFADINLACLLGVLTSLVCVCLGCHGVCVCVWCHGVCVCVCV